MASTSSASTKHGERKRNMQRHMGAGIRRLVTTISCIKILPSWPNEAKNSCVFRLLTPPSNRRRSMRRLKDLPHMLNA